MFGYTEPDHGVISSTTLTYVSGKTVQLERRRPQHDPAWLETLSRLPPPHPGQYREPLDTADYLSLQAEGEEPVFINFKGKPTESVDRAWALLLADPHTHWKELGAYELIKHDTGYRADGAVVMY